MTDPGEVWVRFRSVTWISRLRKSKSETRGASRKRAITPHHGTCKQSHHEVCKRSQRHIMTSWSMQAIKSTSWTSLSTSPRSKKSKRPCSSLGVSMSLHVCRYMQFLEGLVIFANKKGVSVEEVKLRVLANDGYCPPVLNVLTLDC